MTAATNPILVTLERQPPNDCEPEGVYQVSHEDTLRLANGQVVIFVHPGEGGHNIFIPHGGIFVAPPSGSDQVFPMISVQELSAGSARIGTHYRNLLTDHNFNVPPGLAPASFLQGWNSLNWHDHPRKEWFPGTFPFAQATIAVLKVLDQPTFPRRTPWGYGVYNKELRNFAIGNSPPDMVLWP
jgi:hypothetical protein